MAEPVFEMPIAPSELGAFLGGLLTALVKSEITHIQYDMRHAIGRTQTEEEWELVKERVYRDAFARTVACFPESLRERLAAKERELIAAVFKLN